MSVDLANWFQRRICFRNQQIRKKSSLWWPCLWMDQDEISAVHRWSSIDTSYQVSIQLVSEEKIKMCKVNGRQTTDNGRQVMTKAHIAFEARWPKKGINLLSTSVFKDDSMKMLKNRVQSADQAPVRIQNNIVLLVSDCGP